MTKGKDKKSSCLPCPRTKRRPMAGKPWYETFFLQIDTIFAAVFTLVKSGGPNRSTPRSINIAVH